MKKVILLALIVPVMAYGQIYEGFESDYLSKWVQYPSGRWKTDSIQPLSGKYSFHHIFDNPDNGCDRAGIRISNLHPSEGITRWSFVIRHGYDPSSLNNWSVFLMSEGDPATMTPDGGTKGFAVGVNLTGSDDTLRLWKVKGSSLTPVISSGINWQSTIGIVTPVRIIVERSPTGSWSVSVSALNGNLIGSSSGSDSEIFSPQWLGIMYRYSSTRDRLLWIDDISVEGKFYSDTIAPVIKNLRISGTRSIDIILSEESEAGFLSGGNFKVFPSAITASSCNKISALTYRITFPADFVNKIINELNISNICDNYLNCDSDKKLYFTPSMAERGDVIFSEIMADPLPEVKLPGKEYLEISNRTGFPFNLKGWKLVSGEQHIILPEIIINPHQIFTLCSLADTSLFRSFGRVIGLPQFFSLPDGGKLICLTDSSGYMIHGVDYSDTWYRNIMKSAGGWSLEIIDQAFPFSGAENWCASSSAKGGTPGTLNSVSSNNPDYAFHGLQNVFAHENRTIAISFSEPVFGLSIGDISVNNRKSSMVSIKPVDPLFREYILEMQNLMEISKPIELEISENVKDFAGNPIEKRVFRFGLAEESITGDILFNELLFNPLPGDPDYLELYNCSGKIIDASELQFVTIDDESGDTSGIYQLSSTKRCIMPGGYYAVTTNRQRVLDRFPGTDPDYLFEVGSLPPMSDDKGHIVLYNRRLIKIDEISYSQKMHYSLLSGYEGVALEKIDPSGKSGQAMNWHSASESSGWGSPGARNSVFVSLPFSNDKITLSSTRITPDNDGNDDVLVIMMSFPDNGNVVSATVFDENGSVVNKITVNLLTGTEASLVWDGTAEDGTPVNSGIYIILITLYNDKGKTNQWKKVCSVLRR